MKHWAQAIDLVDEPALIREYEQWHRAVWPEVVHALRSIGILHMRIYRSGTRLFMTFTTPDGFDPSRDYQSYAADPRCQEWDALMRKFQRPVPAAKPGEWWSPMECVFDIDGQETTEQPGQAER